MAKNGEKSPVITHPLHAMVTGQAEPSYGTFTLWQLPSQVNTIGNSYVIRTDNGKVIVMDGGVKEEEGYLRGFIAALGNKVDCWFVTHPHPDHIGALTRILENPMDIEIYQICQSTFSDELLAREPNYRNEAIGYYEAVKKSGVNVIEAILGMTFTFGHTTFKILGIKNEELIINSYNNSSMIIKVRDLVKSILFLADAGAEAGDKLLNSPYRKELDCDYMQMAHHGQNGVSMDFYRTVKFRACLWPTPSWVYNNDVGEGFNTHTLTTIETRNTIDSLNITEHYLSFQGLEKIESAKPEYSPYRIPPVIGAWFWGEEQFQPGGYQPFIDQAAQHSCYNLLTTAVRIPGRDITDIDVHNQVKLATAYAEKKGIKIALDLDPRLACRKFEAMYPDELQESLWLEEISLSEKAPVEAVVRSIDFSDHMTGGRTPYISLNASLLRVYAYDKTLEGISPETLLDITKECEVTFSSKDSIVVRLPESKENGRLHACAMVTFTHLIPDVFAPHLKEFTRNIIRSYSDIPLAGGMRDEWGFPPSIPADRMALGNHFWFSKHYAAAYAKKTGGRELLADCLLMSVGIKGKEGERYLAINHYMELNRQQNKILEDDFYQTIKEVFGLDAAVVTHPTWYPYPNRLESKKNGLYWWAAKRDWAQTDEVTPLGIRTALTKKWDSPVWYNQYYSTVREDYEEEIWSCALAGGRINYHPLYPSKEKRHARHIQLFSGDLMDAESKVRLLNFISQSPLDCPVAVIFGHTGAINPSGSYFEEVGMELVNSLWSKGIYTDLIPSSEIEDGSLYIDENGWVRYGKQKYTAVILYNPEFEKKSTADFFHQASQGPGKLFRIGDWTMDFNGNSFDGNIALPEKMVIGKDRTMIVSEVAKELKKRNIQFQTPATRLLEGFGYISNTTPTEGYARLIDGTLIQISGKDNPSGDIINSRMQVGENTVIFNAIGVAAVRLDKDGQVEALAAGGLKYFKSRDFIIDLEERIDLALWRNNKGEIEGIIQGYEGDIPEQLLTITRNWTFLRIPVHFPR